MSTTRISRVFCFRRLTVVLLSLLVLFQLCGLNAMAQIPAGNPPVRPWPPLERINPSPDGAGPSTDYVLGPGDRLTVADYSGVVEAETPLVSQVMVLPDGNAVIHPVGVIHVAGMTLAELNRTVNDLAKKVLLQPDISISLYGLRDMRVYVLGQVEYPGLYQPGVVLPGRSATNEAAATGGISGGNTAGGGLEPIVQNLTVSAVLQEAGGVRDDANVRDIRVTRPLTGQVFQVDLWKLLADGDSREDIILQAGDVVFVPKAVGASVAARELGLAVNYHPRVRVWGAVKSPGLYDLRAEDDVLSILARAGGFTDTAKKRYVLLARVARDGTIHSDRVDIPRAVEDATSIGRSTVHDGDVLIATDSFYLKHWGHVTTFLASFGAAATLLVFNAYLQRYVVNTNRNGGGSVIAVPATIGTGGP